MGTLSGEVTLVLSFLPPSQCGSTLKKKIFAPGGANSFTLRVDPISEGVRCPGKEIRNNKNCLPSKNGGLFMVVYPYTLIFCLILLYFQERPYGSRGQQWSSFTSSFSA